jgi:hypothetical protein
MDSVRRAALMLGGHGIDLGVGIEIDAGAR